MSRKRHTHKRQSLSRLALLCCALLLCSTALLVESHGLLGQVTNPEDNATCDESHAPLSATVPDIPPSVFAGETFTAHVWMKNAGMSVWNTRPHSADDLSPVYGFAVNQPYWSAAAKPLPVGTFYPGDTTLVTVTATAPAGPQEGCAQHDDGSQDCPFSGQMTSGDILFGSACSHTLRVEPFAGQCVFDALSVNDPTLVKEKPFKVTVLCRNTGRNIWKAGDFALEPESPSNKNRWGIQSVPLTQDIAPGDIAIFPLQAASPADMYNAACARRDDGSYDCLLALHLTHLADKRTFAHARQSFHVYDPALTPLPDKLGVDIVAYGMNKDGSVQTVTRGQNTWYFFTVRNTGFGVANNVTLLDPYPRQFFQFVPEGSTAGCNDQGSRVLCAVPGLGTGASVQFQLQYRTIANSPCTDDRFTRSMPRVRSDTTDPLAVPMPSSYTVSLTCGPQSFATPPAKLSAICSDSDGGRNYQAQGTVTAGTGSILTHYQDDCRQQNGQSILVEYYCDKSTPKGEIHACAAGTTCDNGACVPVR